MKKFIIKVSGFAVFCAIFMILVSTIIDPYNVFHINNIRDNGVEPNKNYIKMTYILENPNKYDALMFGSSRVGVIHTENISGENCYNMTYSEGIPAEHLDNIKTLIKEQVPVQKIYLGVDSLSYTTDPAKHLKEQLRSPYEYLKSHPIDFITMYLDASVAFDSLETTKAYTPQENFAENFYNYGWWGDYGMLSRITDENNLPSIGDSYLLEETLADIAEIVTVCAEASIELVVFTNPMYDVTYHESLKQNYLLFLEELAAITDFYNFSGLNDITTNRSYYTEPSHYNAEVGDLMLEYMCNGKTDGTLYEQGFGVYVTEDNISEILDLLKNKQFNHND